MQKFEKSTWTRETFLCVLWWHCRCRCSNVQGQVEETRWQALRFVRESWRPNSRRVNWTRSTRIQNQMISYSHTSTRVQIQRVKVQANDTYIKETKLIVRFLMIHACEVLNYKLEERVGLNILKLVPMFWPFARSNADYVTRLVGPYGLCISKFEWST